MTDGRAGPPANTDNLPARKFSRFVFTGDYKVEGKCRRRAKGVTMPTVRDEPVLQFIRKIAVRAQFARLPDRELLERFVDAQEEEAFAALVCRHGSMVLRVCLQVLANEHDAEDAFQAT